MDDLKEIGVIWRSETTRALKATHVLVLLVLFLLFVGLALGGASVLINQFLSTLTKNAPAMDPEKMREALLQARTQALLQFFTDDEKLAKSLAALPLVLLVVVKLTLRFVPLLIALMGFDQLAGEVGNKSIRYLIVRVKRDSIIFGKFLAQATVFSVLLTVSTLVMMVVTKALNADFSLGDMALWTVKVIGSSVVLALAYLSLTALCSAVVRQGAVALVLNIIALFVIWAIAAVGEFFPFPGEAVEASILRGSPSVMAYVRYLSVWHYGQDLLYPGWSRFFAAALVHLGFAGIFLGLAQLSLKRRDL